jgi:hypothetical protein
MLGTIIIIDFYIPTTFASFFPLAGWQGLHAVSPFQARASNESAVETGSAHSKLMPSDQASG